MRFGSFVFSISSDPKGDHQVIESALREVELAEEIGLDAVWLTEHHFDGAVAYADPLIYNPGGVPPRQPGQAPPPGEVVEHAFLAGSPQRVAAQIAALRDAGVRNLLLNVNVGQISHEKVERSMRLFGAKVLPVVPP